MVSASVCARIDTAVFRRSHFQSQKREPSELKLKVRKEGRTRFLERKEVDLMDEKELTALGLAISDNSVPDSGTGADKKVLFSIALALCM